MQVGHGPQVRPRCYLVDVLSVIAALPTQAFLTLGYVSFLSFQSIAAGHIFVQIWQITIHVIFLSNATCKWAAAEASEDSLRLVEYWSKCVVEAV